MSKIGGMIWMLLITAVCFSGGRGGGRKEVVQGSTNEYGWLWVGLFLLVAIPILVVVGTYVVTILQVVGDTVFELIRGGLSKLDESNQAFKRKLKAQKKRDNW